MAMDGYTYGNVNSYICTNPIDYKCHVMEELGMTDTKAIKEHLCKRIEGITDKSLFERRLDNACRQMIMDFYDGDRTFVKRN